MKVVLWVMPLTVAVALYMIAYHTFLWRWKKKSYSRPVTFLTSLVLLLSLQSSLAVYEPVFALLPVIGLVAVLVRTVLVKRQLEDIRPLGKLSALGYVAVVATMGWILATEYGHTPRSGVDLAFPLAGANHTVFKGGYTLMFNHHRVVKEQEWALDIARPLGISEMTAVIKGKADAFRAFGEAVYAPCSGKVIAAEDGHADLPLGELDPVHAPGNHLIMQCDSTTPPVRVRLAHFQKGTIEVVPGQKLRVGQRVAALGNSGNTSMPHLHIEAQDDQGEAVPLFFGGRFYRGYDRFTDAAATATALAARD